MATRAAAVDPHAVRVDSKGSGVEPHVPHRPADVAISVRHLEAGAAAVPHSEDREPLTNRIGSGQKLCRNGTVS